MKKQTLEKYIDDNFTIKQMAEASAATQASIRYWLSKYGLTPVFAVTHKRKWTEAQMRSAIATSTTISDVLKLLGLAVRAGNYTTVRNFAKKNKIDLSHMNGKHVGPTRGAVEKRIDDILTSDSTYSRTALKRRLLRDGIMKNKCDICGLGNEWNKLPIVMTIDHINGVNNDNRLENLRMLCPNCNSQQLTFCGKNQKRAIPKSEKGECIDCGVKVWEGSERCFACSCIKSRRVERPSKEVLEAMVSEASWEALGRKFGVTGLAVKKWAKQYGIHK